MRFLDPFSSLQMYESYYLMFTNLGILREFLLFNSCPKGGVFRTVVLQIIQSILATLQRKIWFKDFFMLKHLSFIGD